MQSQSQPQPQQPQQPQPQPQQQYPLPLNLREFIPGQGLVNSAHQNTHTQQHMLQYYPQHLQQQQQQQRTSPTHRHAYSNPSNTPQPQAQEYSYAQRGTHAVLQNRSSSSTALGQQHASKPTNAALSQGQWDQPSPTATSYHSQRGRTDDLEELHLAAPSSRLTPSAAPFVPGELRAPMSSQSQRSDSLESQNEAEQPTEENMVEVVRGGCIFFVPESMAYENSAEYEIINEEGFDWAMGATTLPAPPKRSLQTIGIPEPIRQHFQELDIEALRQMPPNDERYKEIPSTYHSAFALDDPHTQRGTAGSFGYPSALYKVTSHEDAQLYALRRFDNVKTTPAIVKNAVDRWRMVRHPSIVSLYNAFLHHRGTLFFAHAYHPTAQTLRRRFIDQQGGLLNEGLIWRLTIQILAGMRAIHSRGMACRAIDPTHILFTSGLRVRINCVGVSDVLEFESQRSVYDLQREDMHALARLILSLGTRAAVTPANSSQALMFCSQHYSQDFQTCVLALAKKNPANVHDLFRMVSVHVADELDMTMASADALHGHLCNEYENGRLLRLLLKLGIINERPGHAMDAQWSETGDRYVLKLFRDFVFHQMNEDGNPVVDFGHIVSSLNKLDAGDSEKALLTSRDEKSLLVVSYADVRNCLEQAFQELYAQSTVTTAAPASSPAIATGTYAAHATGQGYEVAGAHPQAFAYGPSQAHASGSTGINMGPTHSTHGTYASVTSAGLTGSSRTRQPRPAHPHLQMHSRPGR